MAAFASRAKAERVTMENPHGSIWFGAFDDTGTVLGFACMVVKGQAARFKSDYVLPEHRGRGIATALMRLRLERCMDLSLTRATAFCTPLSLGIYLKHGFQAKGCNGRGITFVSRVL